MEKMPSDSETKNISIARKSIHLTNNLSKGILFPKKILFFTTRRWSFSMVGKYCR
jgi:hypothetical protein